MFGHICVPIILFSSCFSSFSSVGCRRMKMLTSQLDMSKSSSKLSKRYYMGPILLEGE